MASAHVILKKIKQRIRVAVSRESKWYPTIQRVICLYNEQTKIKFNSLNLSEKKSIVMQSMNEPFISECCFKMFFLKTSRVFCWQEKKKFASTLF